MSLILKNPKIEIEKIKLFINQVLERSNKQKVILAVSGGIDSALSLKLLSESITINNIYPVLLPFDNQNMEDARLLIDSLNISNIKEVNIALIVKAIAKSQKVKFDDKLRLGNIMARTRMIIIYDLAKQIDALVCGTENKSEKYLGYFTRFGDEASDFEPIVHLYKTQVRQLAKQLNLPRIFFKKPPSAGLWLNQTDEEELGFTYELADIIIDEVIIKKQNKIFISNKYNIDIKIIEKVISRINNMLFKQQVPYKLIK